MSLLHAFPQNDIASSARRRPAATICSGRRSAIPGRFATTPRIRQFTVGVVGNNLLNEDIRNHVSYTKDVVLMPGASVRAFASVKY